MTDVHSEAKGVYERQRFVPMEEKRECALPVRMGVAL